MPKEKETVLVTGSSGCMGQHIVKLLQEKDDNVGEIRLFDQLAYQNKLGHVENIPMKQFIADVKDKKSVLEALSGVDCVIHAACVVDISMFPDVEKMVSTNIEGTKNIIEACIQQNVPRLVYAGSTISVCGTEHIFYGTESTTPTASTFMIGKYGEVMSEGEKLVLQASDRLLENGKEKLRTVAIRSTPFYGEEEKNFVYHVLKWTKRHHGRYQRVRSLDERMQICYVGNAAWAHIKAKNRLAADQTISGEAFFITDDTPIIDINEHLRPYIESRGFKVNSYICPYWLAWLVLAISFLILKFINLFVEFHHPLTPIAQLNYMCSTFFYNRSKAILRLDYEPIYPYEEAQKIAMQYYSKVPL